MNWAYGITTVPSRRTTCLPHTLESLRAAGFDRPRLFVDGDRGDIHRSCGWGLEVTARCPLVGAYGNFVLSLWELWIREPKADRYAMFQDDLLSVAGLRDYLERCKYPKRSFLNLYTHPPPKQVNLSGKPDGWHEADQRCRGAVGLVFDREAVGALLCHPHIVQKPVGDFRPRNNLDGAVSDSLRQQGFTEWVHKPSLLQHAAVPSAVKDEDPGHNHYGQTPMYRDNYDPRVLL